MIDRHLWLVRHLLAARAQRRWERLPFPDSLRLRAALLLPYRDSVLEATVIRVTVIREEHLEWKAHRN